MDVQEKQYDIRITQFAEQAMRELQCKVEILDFIYVGRDQEKQLGRLDGFK